VEGLPSSLSFPAGNEALYIPHKRGQGDSWKLVVGQIVKKISAFYVPPDVLIGACPPASLSTRKVNSWKYLQRSADPLFQKLAEELDVCALIWRGGGLHLRLWGDPRGWLAFPNATAIEVLWVHIPNQVRKSLRARE
jgi:hypothetical protein